MLTEETYAAMAATMRALADELGAPLVFVLEGGYDLDALARSVAATMAAARGDGRLRRGAGRRARASAPRAHYARWWPALASWRARVVQKRAPRLATRRPCPR